MSNTVPHDWFNGVIGDAIVAAEGGVSVNSENRPANTDECGVLKTSSLVDGRFAPDENKVILPGDRQRARVQPRKNRILFSRMNTPALVGQSGFVDKDHKNLFLPDRLWQLTIRKTFDPRWFSYFLRSEHVVSRISDAATGTSNSMKNISKPSLMAIPLTFPPLPEQQKIATILSSVDNVIETTRAQIDKLKDLKTGMMQELLTKGIGHTEFKPLPKWRVGRIAELNKIPTNWELVDLLSVAKLESGHTPSRDNNEYWGGDIQWLSLHDTKNLVNPVLHSTVYSVTQKGIDNSSARILPKDTVALSRTASVGNCVMLGQDMATSQDFANYICSDKLYPKYLLQLFRWMQHVWSNLSEGSTHKTVYMPVFKKLQVLLPPYAEQIKIANAGDKVDADIASKNRKLNMVINLKKALMQDLLSGRVRVNVDQKEPVVA